MAHHHETDLHVQDFHVQGFRAAGLASGIKSNNEKDLGIIVCDAPTVAAGVFTRNAIQAAPVVLDRERILAGQCRALIVNSGVANCGTGEQGMKDAVAMTQMVAKHLNVEPEQVLVASTGVIGARLPMQAINTAIPRLVDSAQPEGFLDFATAIMTTDTVPKLVTRTGSINGHRFTVTGVAKGAGMIHPNMATMLAFLCTDLAAPPKMLQSILKSGVDQTFNRISIDGDTSTNDTVLLLANGQSKAALETPQDRAICQKTIHGVMRSLARKLVKDGEGATKLVTIVVKGAETEDAARLVADTVARSALVKTAFFGEDANWGRIVAAAGRAGIPINPKTLCILFEDTLVFDQGQGVEGPGIDRAADVLKQAEFTITIDLGMGASEISILTCDLSLDYVHINADYRT